MNIKKELLVIILWYCMWLVLDSIIQEYEVIKKYRVEIACTSILIILYYLQKIDYISSN